MGNIIHLCEYWQEIPENDIMHTANSNTEHSRAVKASYKHQFTVFTTYFILPFAKAFLFS